MVNFSGFYRLPIGQRQKIISEYANLSSNDIALISNGNALSIYDADKIIENVIGITSLPLGLGLNFYINGKQAVVPMAIEEPSVVAAASNAAKMCLPKGFIAGADEPVMIGQIQIVGIKDAEDAAAKLVGSKKDIEKMAKELTANMAQRGGGYRTFYVKKIATGRGAMLLVYFEVDMRNAMGANVMNTMLEAMAPKLQEIIGDGKIRVRVLTNLSDKRKVWASALWEKETVGEDAIEGVLDVYELAKNDEYRACTHNKGIMNGIDAVVMATGNDWRAVESGAHAYAARTGKYMPLTHFEKNRNGDLIGKIELPMALGIVGGSIGSNKIAQLSLKIAKVEDAKELAMICACVGLANNFAALRALGNEGIQQGHMELHKRHLK